jgi:hypothetical protein
VIEVKCTLSTGTEYKKETEIKQETIEKFRGSALHSLAAVRHLKNLEKVPYLFILFLPLFLSSFLLLYSHPLLILILFSFLILCGLYNSLARFGCYEILKESICTTSLVSLLFPLTLLWHPSPSFLSHSLRIEKFTSSAFVLCVRDT